MKYRGPCMKWVWKYIRWALFPLPFAAFMSVFSFIAGYKDFKENIGPVTDDTWGSFVKFFPAFGKYYLIVLVVILLLFLFYTLQIVRGGSAGPLSVRQLLRLYTPNRLIKVVYFFHQFQHTLCECDDNLRALAKHNAVSIDNYNTRVLFRSVLSAAREFCCLALAADVSVHIKIFERDNPNPGVTMERLANTSLATYERVDSVHETKRRELGSIRGRTRSERFKVFVGEEGTVQNLLERFPATVSSEDNRVNSAYCYALGNRKHFWIQNDLLKAQKNGLFYSTSKDWDTYYRGLAVFLVAPPVPPGEGLSVIPFGLFIIDSHQAGSFDYYLTRSIGGYIAHRLHFLFRSVYIEESQSGGPTTAPLNARQAVP